MMRLGFGAIMSAASIVALPAWASGGAAGGSGPPQTPAANIIAGGAGPGVMIAPNVRLRLDPGIMVTPTRRDGTDGRIIRHRPSSSSMLDFYPGGEGFHLSAGGRLDRRRLPPSSGNVLLYAPRGSQLGRRGGSFKRFAPAALIGYSETIAKSVTLGIEAGAMMMRGDPATRELQRGMRMASRGNRLDQQSRVNPLVQVAFGLKF